MSLSSIGTPRNGPSGSSPAASVRASSNRSRRTASSCGLTFSMRAMAASTSSAGLTSPRRTSSACPVASSHVVSVTSRKVAGLRPGTATSPSALVRPSRVVPGWVVVPAARWETTMSAPSTIDREAPVLAHHQIDIRASLADVWRLHTDVNRWTDWQRDITEAHIERPMEPGESFAWSSFGFPVTSTVYDLTDHARVLWGGTAGGITGIHEWRFAETPDGVHVVTEESFSGAPVDAARDTMQQTLDMSLGAWLGHLKRAAENAARVPRGDAP